MSGNDLASRFARDGFGLLPEVYARSEVEQLRTRLASVLFQDEEDSSLRSRSGSVYAARNILELFPDAATIWRRPSLTQFLEAVLGSRFGLVRGLFFDKPPGLTWGLPWHKDLTIAVDLPESYPDHMPDGEWRKLTRKAGVPHVEADEATLRTMVTLRIHLDPARSENGALRVIPGSHRYGKELDLSQPEHLVVAEAGDVLAMSPLLSHCSGRSTDETHLHRRILHLEFSGVAQLPFGFRWRNFLAVQEA
jgi:hypothetical protein